MDSDTVMLIFTGVIAVSTVVYVIVTLLLWRETVSSISITRQALYLSAVMHEADLFLRKNEKNPDGSQRFGEELSASRGGLNRYRRYAEELRRRIERADPALAVESDGCGEAAGAR